MARFSTFALILLSLACIAAPAYADDHVALLKNITGSTKGVRGDQKLDATPGMMLFTTDRIVSGPASTAGIVFKDGTLITVGESSEIEIRDYAFETKDSNYQFAMYLAKSSAIYSSDKIAPRRRPAACAARASLSRRSEVVVDRVISLGAVVARAMTLAGCATHPTTTVILMPDEDGHVGAVSVSSPAGTAQIRESFAASTVTGTRAPTAVNAMNRDAVTARYHSLLKAQPPKPVSFILYFHL